MKNPLSTLLSATSLVAAGLLLGAAPVRATNFPGNGSGAWGGEVGQGTLTVTDDGTNITFSLLTDGSSFGGNALALYVDTGAAGFTNTAGFTATGNADVNAIAGYDGSDRSVLTFTNGFTPSYAVAVQGGYIDLFNLVDYPNNFTYITGNGAPTGVNTYAMTFPISDLGLTPGVTHNIKLFGVLLSSTAYRSPEAICGDIYAPYGGGVNPITQISYATYTFDAPTVPTNWVTFSVDMTEQAALGNFNAGNGDTVYAAGTFQASAWSGFQLTNNPSAANTNIYTGTYPDTDTAGTAEQYKFNFYSVANAGSTWEGIANRSFLLKSNTTSVATSYFNLVPASPSATTNVIAFSINMEPQLYLGNFNPGNGDQIEVQGTFQNPQWTAGFILTNSPGSTNVYTGSFVDGNYPGSAYQYKYVIVPGGGGSDYESGANRLLTTLTNLTSLPLAYFNGVSNIYSTPITFTVDMAAPLATGAFNPTNGDVLYAAGTFETNVWTPGVFALTNGAGANAHIYSGTYLDPNPPGAAEQYKFVYITAAGVTNYESLSEGANRTFSLGSSAQSLPSVYWNNADPNNVLLVPTTVTFTINMTNAVDVYGNPFDPANDVVMVDGDFTSPQWQVLGNATDPMISSDYSNYVLTNNPIGSTFYSIQFVVPAGNSLQVDYKYGIDHNAAGINTNVDNEAPFGDNHTRFIRTTGNYSFPADTFGANRTNGAAVEPSFGKLSLGQPAGASFPITWLGRPGVYLEYTTNLVSGNWVQLSATGGTNYSTWPKTNGSTYFRLVNP